MRCLISYDISSQYKRKILIVFLKSYGFIRIQKSVFIGNLSYETMRKKIENLCLQIDEDSDSILLCPLCETDFYKTRFIGSTTDIFSFDEFSDFLLL